jgi:CheY-like chemotaxis protein
MNIDHSHKHQNVLLVDDDSDDRDLFTEAVSLVDPSISVEVKKDGEELMQYLSSTSQLPDVIFLDLNMPKKNGKECLIELRGDKQLSNIPVIIYTTSLNPIDIEDTFKQGAQFFFRKPNSFEEMKEILRKILLADISTDDRNKDSFLIASNVDSIIR